MKKSKYTEEQIAFALKQAEVGTPVEEVCRKMGISDATFYNWRKKYGGLGPSELKRLKQLEEENGKLKRLVADLSLDDAKRKIEAWRRYYNEARPHTALDWPRPPSSRADAGCSASAVSEEPEISTSERY